MSQMQLDSISTERQLGKYNVLSAGAVEKGMRKYVTSNRRFSPNFRPRHVVRVLATRLESGCHKPQRGLSC